MTMKILLVDDHEIMREGICALLRKHPEMEVVGQAADGRMAVDMAKEIRPDVVVMDIGMPNLNGIEATRQMTTENPHLKVMALSTHSDGTVVAKMIKAGATGYMLKELKYSLFSIPKYLLYKIVAVTNYPILFSSLLPCKATVFR